jgi:hypothetical protein
LYASSIFPMRTTRVTHLFHLNLIIVMYLELEVVIICEARHCFFVTKIYLSESKVEL